MLAKEIDAASAILALRSEPSLHTRDVSQGQRPAESVPAVSSGHVAADSRFSQRQRRSLTTIAHPLLRPGPDEPPRDSPKHDTQLPNSSPEPILADAGQRNTKPSVTLQPKHRQPDIHPLAASHVHTHSSQAAPLDGVRDKNPTIVSKCSGVVLFTQQTPAPPHVVHLAQVGPPQTKAPVSSSRPCLPQDACYAADHYYSGGYPYFYYGQNHYSPSYAPYAPSLPQPHQQHYMHQAYFAPHPGYQYHPPSYPASYPFYPPSPAVLDCHTSHLPPLPNSRSSHFSHQVPKISPVSSDSNVHSSDGIEECKEEPAEHDSSPEEPSLASLVTTYQSEIAKLTTRPIPCDVCRRQKKKCDSVRGLKCRYTLPPLKAAQTKWRARLALENRLGSAGIRAEDVLGKGRSNCVATASEAAALMCTK
ncbi:hypothetical protein CcCBS67573_g07906 [Chytriomyces confervae]|uniref:Zn(2)-C6 fungal-type domain-containing protein n=1 Tax=Chytriomyces confervae TaxID=246404 RepID=A0A507ES95_9FUNG|nr:hypothetical protein CcCBS67573_g07906 [Chytriomyces confervae]